MPTRTLDPDSEKPRMGGLWSLRSCIDAAVHSGTDRLVPAPAERLPPPLPSRDRTAIGRVDLYPSGEGTLGMPPDKY